MKKSKIWIHVCVRLLLLITLGVHSGALDINLLTNALSRLSLLRQNIPKDYRIQVENMPKKEAATCWVTLNVFYVEDSLKSLAAKFGNVSSNRENISILIDILQDVRIKMFSLDQIMMDFECHYRLDRWQTAEYFDFIKEFLIAAHSQRESSDDCEPPPCPTTPHLATAEGPAAATLSPAPTCVSDCSPYPDPKPRVVSELVERSLFSLLFIPLAALVFLLVWRVRSRRNKEDVRRNPGEDGRFTGTEGTAAASDAQSSEKNKLNVGETV